MLPREDPSWLWISHALGAEMQWWLRQGQHSPKSSGSSSTNGVQPRRGTDPAACSESPSEVALPSRQWAEPARVCLHPWAAAGQEHSSAQHGDARVTLCCASRVWCSHSWIRGKKPCQSSSPAKPIRCLSPWSLTCTVCESLSWVLSKCMEASTGLVLYPGCKTIFWPRLQGTPCKYWAQPQLGLLSVEWPRHVKNKLLPGEASRCVCFRLTTQYL